VPATCKYRYYRALRRVRVVCAKKRKPCRPFDVLSTDRSGFAPPESFGEREGGIISPRAEEASIDEKQLRVEIYLRPSGISPACLSDLNHIFFRSMHRVPSEGKRANSLSLSLFLFACSPIIGETLYTFARVLEIEIAPRSGCAWALPDRCLAAFVSIDSIDDNFTSR